MVEYMLDNNWLCGNCIKPVKIPDHCKCGNHYDEQKHVNMKSFVTAGLTTLEMEEGIKVDDLDWKCFNCKRTLMTNPPKGDPRFTLTSSSVIYPLYVCSKKCLMEQLSKIPDKRSDVE